MIKKIYDVLRVKYDYTDIIFRCMFSLIFLGLGAEHLVQDELIQKLMPEWLPFKRGFSIIAGIILLTGGASIVLGYKTRAGATLLGLFLIAVTLLIHIPGLFIKPNIHEDTIWIWDILQRSNLVKNLCLLGVCIHLINHRLGKYSLDHYLKKTP